MRLIRIADDRYVLSAEELTQRDFEVVQEAWKRFTDEGYSPSTPGLMILGTKVEYEDRRVPDLEKRLSELEAAIIHHEHP